MLWSYVRGTVSPIRCHSGNTSCFLSSHSKGSSDGHKLSKGGIPLANGDVQLPKPPPWAYPLWSRHETQNYETDRMLKSTSQVIDQAMAQLWETKVKFVNVSFSIEKLGRSRSIALSETERRLRHDATDSHDPPGDSQTVADQPIEWVKVTLSAVPGVNMEDVDDNEPTRKKDHRRVPSTIAMEEVKVSLTFEFLSLVLSLILLVLLLLFSCSLSNKYFHVHNLQLS